MAGMSIPEKQFMSNDKAIIGKKSGPPEGSAEFVRQAGTSSAAQGVSIDDIMSRVRDEVARRRNNSDVYGMTLQNIPVETHTFAQSMPRWTPSAPRLPVKNKYRLSELLAFSDADFIEVAHRAILRRPPDETAFNHYLQVLRGGGAAKIMILKQFLSVTEGQSNRVQIEGLDRPTMLEEWRRKRYIGPIVAWIHALLRLGTLQDRLATSEIDSAREIHDLGRLVNEASEYHLQKVAALKIDLVGRVGISEFTELKNELAAMKSRLETAMSSLNDLMTRDEQTSAAFRALDPFYAAFEDDFRGDRSLVRTRVEPYLALVREVGAGTPEAPVVDIGCGRGEWLELLRDSGLIGQGVEINRVFIDGCRARALAVTEGDAVVGLRAMADCSAGAITAMHVMEHLPFERGIALLDEARRVLRPGGLIILETPNPENLSVGHHWFYMDPTHRKPLRPDSLRWIVEHRGFHEVRIERLFFARESNAPSLLPNDVPGASSINMLLESMRASQDYAIVAKRP